MIIASTILILIVAVLHLGFLTWKCFSGQSPLAAGHSALHLNLPKHPELLPPIRGFTMAFWLWA